MHTGFASDGNGRPKLWQLRAFSSLCARWQAAVGCGDLYIARPAPAAAQGSVSNFQSLRSCAFNPAYTHVKLSLKLLTYQECMHYCIRVRSAPAECRISYLRERRRTAHSDLGVPASLSGSNLKRDSGCNTGQSGAAHEGHGELKLRCICSRMRFLSDKPCPRGYIQVQAEQPAAKTSLAYYY
jgi:hypothetical protein